MKPAFQNPIRWRFSNKTLGQTSLRRTETSFGHNWGHSVSQIRLQTLHLKAAVCVCVGEESPRVWEVGKTRHATFSLIKSQCTTVRSRSETHRSTGRWGLARARSSVHSTQGHPPENGRPGGRCGRAAHHAAITSMLTTHREPAFPKVPALPFHNTDRNIGDKPQRSRDNQVPSTFLAGL